MSYIVEEFLAKVESDALNVDVGFQLPVFMIVIVVASIRYKNFVLQQQPFMATFVKFALFWHLLQFRMVLTTKRDKAQSKSCMITFEKKYSSYTAHLNEKNISTNSPWGFEHVLDTMN